MRDYIIDGSDIVIQTPDQDICLIGAGDTLTDVGFQECGEFERDGNGDGHTFVACYQDVMDYVQEHIEEFAEDWLAKGKPHEIRSENDAKFRFT